MSSDLWSQELYLARLLCPSLSHGVCSDSCPLNRWCYLTILSFATLFSLCLQSLPASGSFRWVDSLHQMGEGLELQLQHQSFQHGYTCISLRPCCVYVGCITRSRIAGVCMLSRFRHVQLFATLRDYSPTDFSVCGILQQGYWSGLPVPTPGDLPELEIKSTSLEFPALGGRFFTTDATWLILFLIFLGIVLLFSTAIVLLYLPTNIVQGVQFLHILTNKLFFYSLHLSVCEMHPIMILICIITNN